MTGADLISLEDAMDELELGPNGGLVYCMEYLLDNMDWLKDELDNFDDDEYIIFDCPGQVWERHVLYIALINSRCALNISTSFHRRRRSRACILR